jgi:hypothetical protein
MEFTTTAVRADNSYRMYIIGFMAIITDVEYTTCTKTDTIPDPC